MNFALAVSFNDIEQMVRSNDPRLTNYLLGVILILLVLLVLVAVLRVLFGKKDNVELLRQSFASFEESSAKTEQALREEITRMLEDVRTLREDLSGRVQSLLRSMIPAATVTTSIDNRLEKVREALEGRLRELQEESGRKLDNAGDVSKTIATAQREEVAAAIADIKETLVVTLDQYSQYLNKTIGQSLTDNTEHQRSQIATIVQHLTAMINAAEHKLESYQRETDARLTQIREESAVVRKFSMATQAFGASLAGEFDRSREEEHVSSR